MANPDDLPTLTELLARPAPPVPQRGRRSGIVGPGISAGIDSFQALSGVGVQALGDFVGSQTISDFGAGIAQRNFAEAARNGRPDLESFPTDDLTKAPAWLGYQVSKQIPQLAATVAAYRLLGPAAARYLPQGAVQAAARAPAWLGGGGLRAGMTAAEQAAATATGARLAAGILAQAPINYPQAVGSMYNEAIQSGNAGPGAAALSMLGGVPYSLMEGFEPGALTNVFKSGAKSTFLKRVASGAAQNALQETVTEGVQTGMEQAFRPDLTLRERAANVVEGAITGGAVGGVFGGVAGGLSTMRQVKTEDPAKVDNSTIKQTVDQALTGNNMPTADNPAPDMLGGRGATLSVPEEEQTAARKARLERQLSDVMILKRENPDLSLGGVTLREQQLRRELDLLENGPAVEPARDFTSGEQATLTNFPVGGAQGPFRQETAFVPPVAPARQGPLLEGQRMQPYGLGGAQGPFRDVGGPTAADINTRVAQEQGPATSDPVRQPELFSSDETLSEASASRRMPVVNSEELAQAQAAARQMLPNTKSKWANRWIDANVAPTDTPQTIARKLIGEIAARDEAGTNLTQDLVEFGKALKLIDQQGRPYDIAADLRQREAKLASLWEKARSTGLKQDQTKATKYQAEVQKLRADAANLKAIMALPAAEQPAPEQPSAALPPDVLARQIINSPLRSEMPVAPGEMAPTPGIESAQILAGAPPVAPAMNFDQRFRQRGIAPAPVTVEEVATPAAPAPVRDASGTQYQSLEARLRSPRAPVLQATVTSQTPQGRAAAALGITTPPSAPTQYVTAQDRAKAKRKRGKRPPAAVPAIPAAPLAQGGSFAAAAPQQSQTDVSADTLLDQNKREITRAKLERIANTDDVGRPMRQAASEALAGLDTFQPGADATAARVLAEHALLTGDIVFSQRPADQRVPPMSAQQFDAALIEIANKLPQTAREVIFPVRTAADLPPAVLAAAERRGMDQSEIRGVLYDGNVYIVQDQVSSVADLQEVIAHEIFGHGGARALLGDQRAAIFSRIFRMVGGLEGLRSLARFYGVEKALNGYLPGRDLTQADQVALTDELMAQAAGRASGKFKTFALAWVSRFKTALINVLRGMGLNTTAERFNTFDPADMAEMLVRMRQAVEQGTSLSGVDRETGLPLPGPSIDFLRTTPQGLLNSAKNLSLTSDNIWNWVDRAQRSEWRLSLNKFHLQTSTVRHIVDLFGKLFLRPDGTNPLTEYWDSNVMRGVAEQRMAHGTKIAYAKVEAATQAPKSAESLSTLMKATFDGIDPRRSWDAHTWLQGLPNSEALKAKHAQLNKLYRSLSERNNTDGNAVVDAYQTLIDVNEGMHFAQQAVSLYNLMMSDKEVSQALKATLRNPMDAFLDAPGTYDNPKASRDFWEAQTKLLVETANKYLEEQGKAAGLADKKGADAIKKNTMSLQSRVATITNEQQAMKQAPYFHLGRFGNWTIKFHIKKGANGKADPAAMDAIAQKFQDGGVVGIEIPRDATRANAFLRFETKAEMEAALHIAYELEKSGHIDTSKNKIEHFDRSNEEAIRKYDMSEMPAWAQGLMDGIRAKEFGNTEGLSDDQKKLVEAVNNEFKRHVTQYFLQLLPDTSLNRIMVHRNNVPGFSSDMIRSFLFRTQVGGRALANLYASSKMADARAGMIETAVSARSDRDTTQSEIKQNVVTELFLRDAQRVQLTKQSWVDTARAFNHAYFLGFSPSYAIVNLTQLGVLLWPELAKKHGFRNSARAIAKTTPTALKVVKAAFLEAKKAGWKHVPDASITKEVLSRKDLGLTEAQIDFILRVVNSGIIDIGSQSRELGRRVEGAETDWMDQGLRWTSSFGYYTEMVTRLTAALAARELHGGNNKEELFKYVDNTVRQSMLSYETWNQARATGRMGLLGEYTPIMTSFMQYTFQLTEKLYREFNDMIRGDTPEQRKAAQKFLVGHLAAVVTLAGTLGMPMANAFAAAFDAVANAFGDDDEEPMNIRVAYRNFLTDTFGDTAGDVIARGVPRVFGMDLSTRTGEQDMIPYLHLASRLLTDKREWQDKVADDTFRMLGSPVSMVNNIILGGSKMLKGDIMEGMTDLMPVAIKGPMKAATLATDGYRDQKGNLIPNITPGGWDVLQQAMGFNPAQNAEYQEERNDQRVLQGAMYSKAQTLREDLAVAIETGDMERAQELIQAAAEFDAKNEDFKILPRMKQVLRARARERQKAQRSGAPLGVKPGLADYTRYGIPD